MSTAWNTEPLRKIAPILIAIVMSAGVAALVALKLTPTPTPSPPSVVVPVPFTEASVQTLRRCTGVQGNERSGVVSVHEFGISGCWVAFNKPFDHDPSCEAQMVGNGSVDADHHFEIVDLDTLGMSAYRDHLVFRGAKERMKFRYTCK